MNNLSWILYFADVADKLGVAATLCVVIFGLASLAGGIAVVGSRVDNPKRSEYHMPLWMLIIPTCILTLSLCVAVFTPSKDTIYLIAGSEIGETVVKTPEAQQMFSDIREVIQQQLKSLKKE